MSLLNLMWKLPNPVVETELTSWYPFKRAPLWLLPSSSCAVAAAPTPMTPIATNARMTIPHLPSLVGWRELRRSPFVGSWRASAGRLPAAEPPTYLVSPALRAAQTSPRTLAA